MTALRQLSTHLAVPLYRNAYALVANTVITAGLGALYWVFAARLFSAEAVGINAAAISLMILIANLSQLNLKNALNRFVPEAGARTGRLISGSYVVAASLAAFGATVFLVGQPAWAPRLDVLRSSALVSGGFLVATVAWTVFVLQDAALTGLRRATWIPPENAAYGLAKIGLLVAFAASAPLLGIFASATLPLLLIIVPVNLLIFRRAVPRQPLSPTSPPISAGVVARFAAADFFASLGLGVTVSLMPVLVLSFAGAAANAYFYLAWTIAHTLFLFGSNTGMSLVTEAALAPRRLHALSRKVLLQTSGIVIPAAIGLVLFAPLLLQFFGSDYSREGTAVLRLLALAAVPYMVIALNVSILRAERRMRALAVQNIAVAGLVVVLSLRLLPPLGIAGVGWAWLIATSLVAAAVLVTNLRFIWLGVLNTHAVGSRTVRPGRWSRRAAEVSTSQRPAVERILADLQHLEDRPDLEILGEPVRDTHLTVATIADESKRPAFVAKIATGSPATASLRREIDALSALHSDARLGGVAGLVPHPVASGRSGASTFVVQSHIGGAESGPAHLPGVNSPAAMAAAAQSIDRLHSATGGVVELFREDTARLVGDRIAAAQRDGRLRVARKLQPALTRLEAELEGALLGQQTFVGWVHGDYWLGNVLIDGSGTVRGIVDWDEMQLASPTVVELTHLLLTTRALMSNRELGAVVVDAVDGHGPTTDELVGPMERVAATALEWRTLVLLTWLHHITSRAHRWKGRPSHWIWSVRNVDPVLGTL